LGWAEGLTQTFGLGITLSKTPKGFWMHSFGLPFASTQSIALDNRQLCCLLNQKNYSFFGKTLWVVGKAPKTLWVFGGTGVFLEQI